MALFVYLKHKYKLGGLEKEMGFRGNVRWSKMVHGVSFTYMFMCFHRSALYTLHSWVSYACLGCLTQL